MKIALTGAHGVGKSTLVGLIGERFNLSVIDNISSNIIINNPNTPTDEIQTMIVNQYLDIFNNQDNFISARGVNDIIAYTQFLQITPATRLLLLEQIKQSMPKDLVQLYIPIKYKLTTHNNPTRMNYGQSDIDVIIRELGYNYKIESVDVGERLDEISDIIRQHYKIPYNFEKVV